VAEHDNHSVAYLFPGQGAQYVGMAADLIDRSPATRALFQKGSELTGFDLERIVRQGPEEELNRTDVSQVAIFLHSLAILDAVEEVTGRPVEPQATCGLSLGEYAALVCAGSIDRDEAIEVVARRGRVMQEAAEAQGGAMTTVLGLERAAVEALIDRARTGAPDEVLGVANWNAPTQIVVSGTTEAVARLEALAAAAGSRRTVRLKVAGGFHSPLMAPAAERLRPLLARLTIRPPRVPFIPNRAGRVVSDPEEIRRCLIDQVTGTVLWTPTVETLRASGVTRAVEAGPGRVLAGLVKRTAPACAVESLATYAAAERFAAPVVG
jgi:[acyl-carrier-protein] S-malonyltransferase